MSGDSFVSFDGFDNVEALAAQSSLLDAEDEPAPTTTADAPILTEVMTAARALPPPVLSLDAIVEEEDEDRRTSTEQGTSSGPSILAITPTSPSFALPPPSSHGSQAAQQWDELTPVAPTRQLVVVKEEEDVRAALSATPSPIATPKRMPSDPMKRADGGGAMV